MEPCIIPNVPFIATIFSKNVNCYIMKYYFNDTSHE